MRAAVFLGWAAAAATHAAAQSADDRAGQPLWELGLGATALSVPHYRGSDQRHGWLLPLPYVVYRGDVLKSDRDGTRALLARSDRVDFDLSVDASPPAAGDGNRARAGMPDLDATVAVGPRLNVRLARGAGWKVDLRVPLRAVATVQASPRFIGWTLAPVVNLDMERHGWNVGLQGGPIAATRRYHGYFYDVAPAYATPQRPAYAAPGGHAGWQATASVSRRAGAWWLAAFCRLDTVAGAAFEASPLVRQRGAVTAGLAVSRVFWMSGERVVVDR